MEKGKEENRRKRFELDFCPFDTFNLLIFFFFNMGNLFNMRNGKANPESTCRNRSRDDGDTDDEGSKERRKGLMLYHLCRVPKYFTSMIFFSLGFDFFFFFKTC